MKHWDYDMPVWATLIAGLFGILFAGAILFGIVCLSGWLIMLLWNATLPAIFGIATLTFWQAVGIDLLITVLCGGVAKIIVKLLKALD